MTRWLDATIPNRARTVEEPPRFKKDGIPASSSEYEAARRGRERICGVAPGGEELFWQQIKEAPSFISQCLSSKPAEEVRAGPEANEACSGGRFTIGCPCLLQEASPRIGSDWISSSGRESLTPRHPAAVRRGRYHRLMSFHQTPLTTAGKKSSNDGPRELIQDGTVVSLDPAGCQQDSSKTHTGRSKVKLTCHTATNTSVLPIMHLPLYCVQNCKDSGGGVCEEVKRPFGS